MNEHETAESQIIKRNDPKYVFSYISREINIITDGDKINKKKAINELYQFVCITQPCLKTELIQEILITFNKNFIKLSLFDPIDKVKELTLKTLIYLYSNCINVTKFFPFIFSALVDKLDCNDLEGYSKLPEDIRPIPSQNPQRIIKVTEEIEEIRVLYVLLLEALTQNENVNVDEYKIFTQDIVNIARTLCMDPCVNVSVQACELIEHMASRFNKELLYYFNSILSRAVLYPLSHKQAKLRIAGLNALNRLMYCSPFKKNVEIMEQLIGFRDPNMVPIKDFYEPSTKFNYFAYLSNDPNQIVLKRFYEVITSWMIDLEDRGDHEGRIVPYLLSGLFDKNEDIALYVCEQFEQIGKQYEKDNEKDIREQRQFGVDAPWCKYCGDINKIINPFPLSHRPNLGSRIIVRKYLRRYIKSLCKEFERIEESIKLKVANLLLYSIVYSEESIVEYLDGVLLCIEREYITQSNNKIESLINRTRLFNQEVFEVLTKVNNILGRFCDYDSLIKLLFPTIQGELNGNYNDIQRGAIIVLKNIIVGHLNSCEKGFGMFSDKLKLCFSVMGTNDNPSDFLDSKSSFDLIGFYSDIINAIYLNLHKQTEESIKEFEDCTSLVFNNILMALGANEYLIKIEVFNYIDQTIIQINNQIQAITKQNTETPYFSTKVLESLNIISEYLKCNFVSMQNKHYKILYLFLKSKLFFTHISDDNVVFQLLDVFNQIFDQEENFNVHANTITLFLGFLQETPFIYKDSKEKKVLINTQDLMMLCINNIVKVISNALKSYVKIEGDEFKFKFVDLLKDKQELEKKKMRNPKTLKSNMRNTLLLFLKFLLTKSEMFAITNQSSSLSIDNKKKIALGFYPIFNHKQTLTSFVDESDSIRQLFSSVYYQYIIKLFVFTNKDMNIFKEIIENVEYYVNESVYDSVVEVRQTSINILNLVLNIIPKSQFYDPMKELFSHKENDEMVKEFQFEAIKAMVRIEDETKIVDSYFKEFKTLINAIVNMYLDEKLIFGTLCDSTMKIIIERFPIYTFNEMIKAQKKNQMGRIDFFNRMLKKHLAS